jgi:NitT/TauT family transport system substrate-binding protein
MPAAAETTKIKILAGTSIFTVPEHVAVDEGYFADEGLEVITTAEWEDRNHVIKDPVKDPLAQFESGTHDTFNMCEWGVLRRLENTERPAHISYLRPAIVAQALISFRDDIQEPHDLAGVPVGINETTGQHFTALKILEGSLKREEIVLEHGGDPSDLLAHLHADSYAAVTLMEPFISLALKEGGHVLAHTFYRGAQAFADSVPVEARAGFIRAVNRAVDKINEDPKRYRSYITSASNGKLEPEELRDDYYRFRHSLPYSEERFADQWSWLREWGLVEADSAYESIIDPAAAALV